MDASDQAAEQLLRMTLSGSEVALRLTGAGAKNIAAALMAAVSSKEQTKGKTRLETMLKSGKELKVFQIKDTDLKDFAAEAKKYGVLYVVVKRPHGKEKEGELVDLMVKAEDASKINRIIDKLELIRVDQASVGQVVDDIEKSRDEKTPEDKDIDTQGKDKAKRLLDELLTKPAQKESERTHDPLVKTEEAGTPLETISANVSRSEKTTTRNDGEVRGERKSVREAIDEIKQERDGSQSTSKVNTPAKETTHVPPAINSKKAKPEKGR